MYKQLLVEPKWRWRIVGTTADLLKGPYRLNQQSEYRFLHWRGTDHETVAFLLKKMWKAFRKWVAVELLHVLCLSGRRKLKNVFSDMYLALIPNDRSFKNMQDISVNLRTRTYLFGFLPPYLNFHKIINMLMPWYSRYDRSRLNTHLSWFIRPCKNFINHNIWIVYSRFCFL